MEENEEKFQRLKKSYNDRRFSLILAGRFQHSTSHGYWAPSDPEQIFELFSKLGLERYNSFIDLGSGDGIVAAIASLFTKAAGIEGDPELHSAAESLREELKLDYSLVCGDFLESDLAGYDAIFMYPDNNFHRIEKKLVEEFKGVLIMIDAVYSPLTLSPEKSIEAGGAVFSMYRFE